MNSLNPVSIILILNSMGIISLVLTQNETTKDYTTQNSSRINPIENLLWIIIIFEILMFLITGKITDF
jgi:hypothetical protein